MAHCVWTYAPFADRSGRVSRIKLVAFIACCIPAVWMSWRWGPVVLDPRTTAEGVFEILRQTGDWSLRFLAAAFAITPLRYVTRFNDLYLVRRMLGLTALFYGLAHLACWWAHEDFVWRTILRDSVSRAPLVAGHVALLVMLALGLTSNEAAIRRLGAPAWRALHACVYAAVVAGLFHALFAARVEAAHGVFMAGFCVLLMGFRGLRSRVRDVEPASLQALAVAAFVATVLIGAGHEAWSTGEGAHRLLWAQVDLRNGAPPAWWVLCAGLALAAARGASRHGEGGRSRRRVRPGAAENARS